MIILETVVLLQPDLPTSPKGSSAGRARVDLADGSDVLESCRRTSRSAA